MQPQSRNGKLRAAGPGIVRLALIAGLALIALINVMYAYSGGLTKTTKTAGSGGEASGGGGGPSDELVAHLFCGDVDASCEKRRHAGNCSTRVLEDFHVCTASCGLCPALEAGVTAFLTARTTTRLTVLREGGPVCRDEEEGCAERAKEVCSSTDVAVVGRCKATCGACLPMPAARPLPADACYDALDMCAWWAGKGRALCERAAASPGDYWWVAVACRRSCGLCSVPAGEEVEEEKGGASVAGEGNAEAAAFVVGSIAEILQYGVQVGVDADGTPRVAVFEGVPADPASCVDKKAECADWKAAGECASNAAFMADNCPASCGACPTLLNLPLPLAQVRLNNGVLMPTIGYGCAALGGATAKTVKWALEAGYRHLDTAQAREWYREDLVGQALEEHLQAAAGKQQAAGGRKADLGGKAAASVLGTNALRREDVFITSKLHPRHLGYATTLKQFNESLKDLRTPYVDLFLLHYPECWGDLCGGVKPEGTFLDSWRALEEIYEAGLARAIGVSNFGEAQLQQLLAAARVRPAVLQVHVDPLDHAQRLQELCRGQGLVLTAYSTLGTQWGGSSNPVLGSPVLADIGKQAGGRSPAQVALRWALQQGLVVLPRSSNPDRIRQNLVGQWGWELGAQALQKIAALKP